MGKLRPSEQELPKVISWLVPCPVLYRTRCADLLLLLTPAFCSGSPSLLIQASFTQRPWGHHHHYCHHLNN